MQNHDIVETKYGFSYVVKAILLGLLTTQLIATLQVYLSNLEIYRTTVAIMDAGFFPIPNSLVLPTLKQWGPAFWGGLFFTLSIGTGLSILSVTCAWIWVRLFKRNRIFFMGLLLAWFGIIFLLNRDGFTLMATLYFLMVPAVAFLSILKWIPKQTGQGAWIKRLCVILPIALLTGVWTYFANSTLFLDIRDFLLLSNPMGQKVDAFYYKYTLYPAEVFKTLDQKTLKTCQLSGIRNQKDAEKLERLLIRYDYLPIETAVDVDMEIHELGVHELDHHLVFKHKGKTVVQTTMKAFLSRPGDTFKEFSAVMDRFGFFRQTIFISILVGFPLFLYMMVFAFLRLFTGFFTRETVSMVLTALICLITGLVLLVPFVTGNITDKKETNATEDLYSETWQKRVHALRIFIDERREIGDAAAYQQFLTSPHIPVRYWFAQALGVSKDPKTYPVLVTLLNDPHPNVVSMALRSLGQRRDKRAIKEIINTIESSDHWYNQWYAYRALRSLGWRQSRGGEQ